MIYQQFFVNKLGLSCAKLRPALVYLQVAIRFWLAVELVLRAGATQAAIATPTYPKQALDDSMYLYFKARIRQSCPITCLGGWVRSNGRICIK